MPAIQLNDFQVYRLFEFIKGQQNKGVPHWRRVMRLHDSWKIEALEEIIQENTRMQNEYLQAGRVWEGNSRQGPPPEPPKMTEFRSDAKAKARETEYADLEYLNRMMGEWDKEELPTAGGNQPSALPANASQLAEVYLAIFDAIKTAWDKRAGASTADKIAAKKAAKANGKRAEA